MPNFANLTANLNLNIQNFSSNLRKASGQVNKFAANLRGTINDGLVDSAKKSKFEFKDVARIVQGILISKAFYSGLNAIRNCSTAVWEFSQELEYAKIAYSNLFGDTSLAQEFINVLKDFAATTPFSFSESEAAAKRLLAYGIQYKNVMYVMQGVLAASSMQNNPQIINSVSRALGQIYTKGRLMNEEMRQLAEAGIPAYEILQQKLGLTNEQLQNLGREGIPASKAINAIVDGMTERFGGVVEASTKTTQGIISNIKDNAVMIASGVFEPLHMGIKSALNALGEFLANLREIYELKGVGGVFEAIFPEEMHGTIRQFAANIMVLFKTVANLVTVVRAALAPALNAAIQAFNALVPVVSTLVNLLATIIGWLLDNAIAMKILTATIAGAAAMWVVFKVKALASTVVAGVIALISKALAGLSVMLSFVVAHPFWTLLIGMVGLVVGLSGGFGKLSNAISGLFKQLTAFNGVDPNKLLLPSQEERANDLEKFNDALDGTSDSMDDLADSTGKATKAAKGLLAFDEVFKLNEPDEGTDNGIDTDNDFEIPDFSGLGEALIPEIPDLTKFAENFVQALLEPIKNNLMSAGIGAIIGGVLGNMLGGPLAAKIGVVAGAVAGWFWAEVAEALNITDTAMLAWPIATALGAAIGLKAGGPLGAAIGAGIGAVVGWIINEFTKGFQGGDWAGVGLPTGLGIGAAIGAIVGGPPGAAIGAAIGVLVGWIVDLFVKGFTEGEWDWTGIGIGVGTGIGAAIGAIAGGPPGALIGAAAGALGGWLADLISDAIIENWDSITQFFTDAGNTISGFFADIWNSVTGFGAALGAAAGLIFGRVVKSISSFFTEARTAIGNVLGWIGQAATDVWNAISNGVTQTLGPAVDKISDIFSGAWEKITMHFDLIRQTVRETLGSVWDTITDFSLGLELIPVKLGMIFSHAWTVVSTSFTNIVDTIRQALIDAWSVVVEWFTPIYGVISNVCAEAWTAVSTWFQNIWNKITEVAIGAWTTVSTWFQSIWDTIVEKLTGAVNAMIQWRTDVVNTIADTCTNIWNTVSAAFQNVWNVISNALINTWNTVSIWFQNIWNTIVEKLTGAVNTVIKWRTDLVNTIVSACTSAWTAVSNWFSNIWNTFTNSLANVLTAFKNWVKNLWDSVFGKLFGWIDDGIDKLREFLGLNPKGSTVNTSGHGGTGGGFDRSTGHAVGGIFNREHIARFAEGNKAEAIIPLENASAMQPFVDAVANGLTASLMPIVASISGGQDQLPPVYVGTLIADETGLKELERKMRVIRVKEERRGG